MERIIENSSQIAKVVFDADKRAITVTFKPKMASYEYAGCSEREYNDIINAESVGKAVNTILKDSGKPWTKVVGPAT